MMTPQKASERLTQIDAGILTLLDERVRVSTQLREWHAEHADGTALSEEKVLEQLHATNKALTLTDEKLIALWGKVVELTDRHFQQ